MKHLRMTRRSARDWAQWRLRRRQWPAVEECRRCAGLEARVAVLTAELAARGTGERVVVVWRNGESTPGGRVQALVDSLLTSMRNHPVVWGFIGMVAAGVFGTIFYNTVILWMLG